MRNSLVIAIFLSSLLCCILLSVIAVTPAASNATGIPHPTIPYMRVGGDGLARVSEIGIYAYLFQGLTLINFAMYFLLGISRRKRDRWLYLSLLAYLSLTIFIWHRIFSGHLDFLNSGESPLLMGFPVCTSWMLYGVWGSGMLLILLYCLCFPRYIYCADDQLQFEAILREYQEQE